mmetsp:Transcript_9963/g.16678  ORF Transcript_9963/g.16678 Transcript_9963/m.16678 type:complete len:310 (-) Transcript_9963:40-969(-)
MQEDEKEDEDAGTGGGRGTTTAKSAASTSTISQTSTSRNMTGYGSLITQNTPQTRPSTSASSSMPSEDVSVTNLSDLNSDMGEADDDGLPVSSTAMQTRYLVIHFICRITELYREEALAAQRDRNYRMVTLLWGEAYRTLFNHREELDRWFSILTESGVNPELPMLPEAALHLPLRDKHSAYQIFGIWKAVDVLMVHTETERRKALEKLGKEKMKLENKLVGVNQTRDSARSRMGEEAWNNNPNPISNVAMQRNQWSRELKHIDEAIEKVNHLVFSNRVDAAANNATSASPATAPLPVGMQYYQPYTSY